MAHTVYPLYRINSLETTKQAIHRHAPGIVMLHILTLPFQHAFAQKRKPGNFHVNLMHRVYPSVSRFQCFEFPLFIKPQVHDAACQQAHQLVANGNQHTEKFCTCGILFHLYIFLLSSSSQIFLTYGLRLLFLSLSSSICQSSTSEY